MKHYACCTYSILLTLYFLWQFSSSFLESISTHVDPKLPFISLSKGLELNTLRTMSKIIPRALGNRRQPFVVLSGPSFAVELMNKLPTGLLISLILFNCYVTFFFKLNVDTELFVPVVL